MEKTTIQKQEKVTKMIELISRKYFLPAFLATASLLIASTGATAQGNSQGANGAANGQPFDALQQQIEALKSQVETLTAIIGQDSVEIYVDCAAGDTVNGAITSAGDAPNPLIITISGTCSESVIILRSNVTLRGQSPGDGINGVYAVLASRGANNINIESMTLSGARAGLSCWNGASVTATDVNIVDSSTGVMSLSGGSCQIIDSSIDNNFYGVSVSANSSVWLRGVAVTNSSTGANVFSSSSLLLGASPSNGSYSTISGGDRGIEVFANGSLRLLQAIIENNNTGISAGTGGSIFAASSVADIQNNATFGIRIDPLSNAILGSGVSITGNGGWGLECYGTHSVGQITFPVYSNNLGGDIHPNCGVNQ